VQRRGARADGARVARPAVGGELLLERGDFDADTGALTMLSVKQFSEAMTPQTARSVFTRAGDDRFSVVDHTLDEATGAWWESFSFHCERK